MEDITGSLCNLVAMAPKDIKCVEGVTFSSFNPPPSYRRVLIVTSRVCIETLRPFAYSLLAEIVHYVRSDRSLYQDAADPTIGFLLAGMDELCCLTIKMQKDAGEKKGSDKNNRTSECCISFMSKLNLDGLVIIGGVTSNTDAAQLAETFAEKKCSTKVNSQLVSNKCIDALSAEKCMRNGIIYFSAGNWLSYVSQIQDTLFISMEILLSEDNGLADIMQELERLINAIVDVLGPELVADKYHGVILLPEGLIESIPEVYALLQGLAVMIFSFDEVSNKVVYAGVPNNRLKDGFGVL